MRPLLLLALAATAAAAADNWPEFRGPTADGRAAAKHPPLTWAEDSHVAWKTAIHDKGWSSPVIWGDQIWMTTATADGKELFAVCVDKNKGKIVHDLKLFTVEKPGFCPDFNSYASPTPAIEDGRVYVHFGSPGTACLDTANGKVLWERRDLKCDHWRAAGSSPVLHGKHLFLIFDGHDVQYVCALDKATGQTVWKKDRTIAYTTTDGDLKKAFATPRVIEVDGKAQLVCPSAEATIAYDPADGTELWRVVHGGMNAASRVAFGEGHVYLTSGHTMKLLAVKTGGKGDVTKSHVDWTTNKGVPTRPSLILTDGLLFMVSDNGIASCLDAKTGERHWQERVGGSFSASPVLAAGKLYLADQDGATHVLEAGTKFKELAVNKLAAGCMASPAFSGDALFLRTKTHLYRIEQPR